jgi:RNase P/RNase MRP subunit POP5
VGNVSAAIDFGHCGAAIPFDLCLQRYRHTRVSSVTECDKNHRAYLAAALLSMSAW